MMGESRTVVPFRREAWFGDRVVAGRVDRPANFHAMLRDAVRRNPAGEALVCGGFRVDWQTLATIVEETAAGLAELGAAKGDRIALLIGNRAEFVISLHAIARLGAIAVPISVREQAPGIAHAIGHSGARLLMYDPAFAAQLPQPGDGLAVEKMIPTGAAGQPWSDLRSATPAPAEEVAETDVAAILYTSGTTGKPKGAMITHANIVHAAMVYEEVMALGAAERSIVTVPMTHVTGLTGMIASMTRCSGTLIIMPEFKADAFVALAAAEAMTHTVLVPAMYNLILTRVDLSQHDLSKWRIGGFGGAPMPAPTIQGLGTALPALGLMNLYGATETSCPVLVMPADQALARCEQVGRAAPGAEVLIMDPDGRECPAGTAGELWLRGATVVPGYWQDPAATQAALVGGFWRSGDVGTMDAEGYVAVHDRIKDMIIRGGFKIYSAEVESVLAEHPGVLESAVVGRPCPVLGERVHAFVAMRGDALDPDELAQFCASRLADYKRPETFTIQIDPLPRNANGKLLKREMRADLLPQPQYVD